MAGGSSWPHSVWLVVLAGHEGKAIFSGHPAIGLHLSGGGGVILWLAVLDAKTSSGSWWYWPAIAWVVLGNGVMSMSVDLLRGIGTNARPNPARDAGARMAVTVHGHALRVQFPRKLGMTTMGSE